MSPMCTGLMNCIDWIATVATRPCARCPARMSGRTRERAADHSRVRDTWYHRFIQVLHTGVAKHDIESIFDNVAIITFNYDRCIEHFIPEALQAIYHIPAGDAYHLAAKLTIIHPHG